MKRFAIALGAPVKLLGLGLMVADGLHPPFTGAGAPAIVAGMACLVAGMTARRR